MLVWDHKGDQNRNKVSSTPTPACEVSDADLPHSQVSGDGGRDLQHRMMHLESTLAEVQGQLERLTKSNENNKKDMRFFETMLLEEYHLLLQLLDKDQNIQIQGMESV